MPPAPVISKVTSPETSANTGLPVGITSGHASSLHSNGAVSTFVFAKVHDTSSENVAVNEIALPFAGNTTLSKVCGDVKPTAETETVPSPVKSNVPAPGEASKVTVMSAVNVSSVKFVGVPLSLQAVTSLEVILKMLNPASTNTIGLFDTAKHVGVDWYLTTGVYVSGGKLLNTFDACHP